MAKKVVEDFQCDPDFCPECGSIMPLVGPSEDVVTCKQCAFQRDASGKSGLLDCSKKCVHSFLHCLLRVRVKD